VCMAVGMPKLRTAEAQPPSLRVSCMTIDEKCMAHARECVRLAGLTDDQEVRDQLSPWPATRLSLLGRRRRRTTTTAKCWFSRQQSSVVAATGYGCPCVTQVRDGFPE